VAAAVALFFRLVLFSPSAGAPSGCATGSSFSACPSSGASLCASSALFLLDGGCSGCSGCAALRARFFSFSASFFFFFMASVFGFLTLTAPSVLFTIASAR